MVLAGPNVPRNKWHLVSAGFEFARQTNGFTRLRFERGESFTSLRHSAADARYTALENIK
jgi:hypothetical protein